MKTSYTEKPLPVKSADADLRRSYPLLCGFRIFLINAFPFALIWLAAGAGTLMAALTAFLMMLFHCLRENYLRNRHLSEMARKLKERGNA